LQISPATPVTSEKTDGKPVDRMKARVQVTTEYNWRMLHGGEVAAGRRDAVFIISLTELFSFLI
jgi:hypothetical protein